MVTRAELLKLLASLPSECEGCSAPLAGPVCEYCGRPAAQPDTVLPDEPPDIRKTNAADDICQACGTVHSKDSRAVPVCRCLYCGQVGPVAMSTTDARLGTGVVCRTCCGGAPRQSFQQLEAEALARQTPSGSMPWDR